MPRFTRLRILHPTAMPLETARRLLQPSIVRLLSEAGAGNEKLNRILEAIAAGLRIEVHPSIAENWLGFAVLNVAINVRQGGYYLRRCQYCNRWMFVKAKHRLKCNRHECQQAEWAANKESSQNGRADLDAGLLKSARRA